MPKSMKAMVGVASMVAVVAMTMAVAGVGIGSATAGTGSGQPASNSVYGRMIGIDFGTGTACFGAPSGVVTCSGSTEVLSEELSATKALALKNLHVSLVVPFDDNPDPVPVGGFPIELQIFSPGVTFTTNLCIVQPGSSTCAVTTVGTLPAGSFLRFDVENTGSPLPGYTPDVVFTYQAVPQ